MVQEAAVYLVFIQAKTAYITALFITLQWLPVAVCIKFNAKKFGYRVTISMAPPLHEIMNEVYEYSQSLQSANAWRLVLPQLWEEKSQSKLLSSVVPLW